MRTRPDATKALEKRDTRSCKAFAAPPLEKDLRTYVITFDGLLRTDVLGCEAFFKPLRVTGCVRQTAVEWGPEEVARGQPGPAI